MNPTELAAHITDATGAVERSDVTAQGQLGVHVSRDNWVAVARHLKDCPLCGFGFFTFLSAVDLEDQGFEIVAHMYSVRRQQHVNLKTMVPREGGSVPTLSEVWLGANWHERETHELFGIRFDGHPHLTKLLLPEQFEGHPLRKEFLLMTREAKEWPGEKEPEEVHK